MFWFPNQQDTFPRCVGLPSIYYDHCLSLTNSRWWGFPISLDSKTKREGALCNSLMSTANRCRARQLPSTEKQDRVYLYYRPRRLSKALCSFIFLAAFCHRYTQQSYQRTWLDDAVGKLERTEREPTVFTWPQTTHSRNNTLIYIYTLMIDSIDYIVECLATLMPAFL